jgi:diguanylate cyclase (GGDEF)-like protein
VSAEAAGNTKNVVEPMRKILLIDQGNSSVHRFRKTLTNKGFILVNGQNIKTAVSLLSNDQIDLIIIDGSVVEAVNASSTFIQQAADIPVIILLSKDNATQKSYQPKDRHAVVMHEPVKFKDLYYWINRLLQYKSMEHEHAIMQTKLSFHKKELVFFNETTSILSATSDLGKILNSMMENIKAITGAGAWSILFNDEPFVEIIHFRSSRKIRKFRFQKGVGIIGWVLESNAPVIIDNITRDKRYNRDVDTFSHLKISSLVCAPMQIKDRVVGVLRLMNKKKESSFTEADMNLLVNAARYAAMATERAFLYEEIKNDDLTNLYNFRYLHQALDMEIERAQRYGSLFALIFMDLDNFKEVNDRNGHLIGSRLLVEISNILRKNLRTIDVITRYGGDEFVMILPQTTQDGCFEVAERLRKIIEKNIFLKSEGFSIKLTASFGVASFPDIAKNKEELIHLADKAMYRGKFSSKNIVFAAK